MSDLLFIEGGRVVDPSDGVDFTGHVFVEDGKIKRVCSSEEKLEIPEGAKVIDASGKWVFPGLVDLHTHLREPGQEDKETIETGMHAAAAGGFTTICAMPNTKPVNDNKSVTGFIMREAESHPIVNVWPIGAITKGSGGKELAEIGEMKRLGIVAISDDGVPVMNAQLMRHALEYSSMFDLPVISHCEDLSMTNSGVMHEGVVSTCLGLRGISSSSEESMVVRDISLVESFGGHLHIAHVSTKGSVRAIRAAKARGVSVTAEVTPHHLFLTDEAVRDFDTNTKMNPPLRAHEDTQALIEGLRDGTIDIIATDHAPHTTADKEMEYASAPFGIVGLETALPLIVNGLYHGGILSPSEIVQIMAYKPAQIIGKGCGTLKEGADADIVIIDPEAERTVDKSMFFSKGRNTPFDGWLLKGCVTETIKGGAVVFTSSGSG